MLEKTKKDIEKALVYCEQLIEAPTYDPNNRNNVEIPKEIGVYLWRSKKDGEIVYIGRALNKKGGLYTRIIKQHLWGNYTTKLEERMTKHYGLDTKEKNLKFLMDNFSFSFITVNKNEGNTARFVEDFLINEYSPKYNTRTLPF